MSTSEAAFVAVPADNARTSAAMGGGTLALLEVSYKFFLVELSDDAEC